MVSFIKSKSPVMVAMLTLAFGLPAMQSHAAATATTTSARTTQATLPQDEQKKWSNQLIEAAHSGNRELVEKALKSDADIEAVDDSDGYTALMWAAEQGHTAIVRFLLDRGADVNATSDGTTALTLATYHNKLATVRILLERGANINAKTREGLTALMLSSQTKPFNPLLTTMLLLAEAGDRTQRNALARNQHTHEPMRKLLNMSDEGLIQTLTPDEYKVVRQMLWLRTIVIGSIFDALRMYKLFRGEKFLRLFLSRTNLRRAGPKDFSALPFVEEFERRSGVPGSAHMDVILFGNEEQPGVYDFLYGHEGAQRLQRDLAMTLDHAVNAHDINLVRALIVYGARVPAPETLKKTLKPAAEDIPALSGSSSSSSSATALYSSASSASSSSSTTLTQATSLAAKTETQK